MLATALAQMKAAVLSDPRVLSPPVDDLPLLLDLLQLVSHIYDFRLGVLLLRRGCRFGMRALQEGRHRRYRRLRLAGVVSRVERIDVAPVASAIPGAG